jgi:hypothetical protein
MCGHVNQKIRLVEKMALECLPVIVTIRTCSGIRMQCPHVKYSSLVLRGLSDRVSRDTFLGTFVPRSIRAPKHVFRRQLLLKPNTHGKPWRDESLAEFYSVVHQKVVLHRNPRKPKPDLLHVPCLTRLINKHRDINEHLPIESQSRRCLGRIMHTSH